MTFFAIIAALLLAYYLPKQTQGNIAAPLHQFAHWMEHYWNTGERHHAKFIWLFGAMLPAILLALAYYFTRKIHPLLGLAFSTLIFYACLSNTHDFFEHADKLSLNNNPSSAIETHLLNAFQGILTPIIWFALAGAILGPAIAVLYRLTHNLNQSRQNQLNHAQSNFLPQVIDILDWLPSRICAGGFAIVGDFEDAIFCWREQSASCANENLGILLSSGAGALGVVLTKQESTLGTPWHHPEIGIGEAANDDDIKSSVGMVWRVLILFIAVVLLLTLASWIG